ncbi:hypothetical protein CASFOL_030013 [Castilleja foliolosa]|uniref:F-box/kelch-repeat protein n=1 Tax=Castilleja foliolosa TaxID=1961234 RepID=A0ABD3CAS0_9LAMI
MVQVIDVCARTPKTDRSLQGLGLRFLGMPTADERGKKERKCRFKDRRMDSRRGILLYLPFRGWLWEVWEMKPETGEWTKLSGIEIHDLKDRKGQILGWIGNRDTKFKSSGSSSIIVRSVGWLKYKEVLLFKVYSPDMRLAHRFCYAWNVRTKEIQFIELDSDVYPFLVHRHSLVWLDGC